MWNDIIGILNFLGPVQTLLLIIVAVIAIVFIIGDWRWGKHGYDPDWMEEQRNKIERKYHNL